MENNFDAKTLQAKLEKFAGFKEVRFKEPPYEVAWVEDKYGKMFTDGVLDLINDLNAQREYLYPKLLELNCGFVCGMFNKTGDTWARIYRKLPRNKAQYFEVDEKEYCEMINKNLPLAFALACEKLIDELEKK